MPKGKAKDKGRKRAEADSAIQSSDDEQDGRESVSIVSNCSDTQATIRSTDGSEDQDVDDSAAKDNFEDKLKELIEGTTQKSAKGRVDSLVSLRKALATKYIYDFISERKMTTFDSVERCLKKGKGDEQAAAATCMVLLLVQLGIEEGEGIFREVAPIMKSVLADSSASPTARTACAEALGLCTFVACDETEETLEVMKAFENIFSQSYCKGDGSVPNHTPDIAILHTSALSAWMLLMSVLPYSDRVLESIYTHLGKLPDILLNSDVEIRIAAGEAIALLYEIARTEDEDFDDVDFDSLCDQLKRLSTESHKYRAKKDRRHQKSSFRDILSSVEKGDFSSLRIHVSDFQSVTISDWTTKMRYDAFCRVLGTGMKVHLQENELLRDIFGLGPPMLASSARSKASRNERHVRHDAAFKARTKTRSKMRDKKMVPVGND